MLRGIPRPGILRRISPSKQRVSPRISSSMQRILSFFSRQVAGLEVAAREAAARERALHDKCSEEGQARARIETDFAAAAVT